MQAKYKNMNEQEIAETKRLEKMTIKQRRVDAYKKKASYYRAMSFGFELQAEMVKKGLK